MFDLCPPALIYLVFSLTQIIIDLFKGLYNTAFFKVIVMIMVTILLNALCQGGLGIVSWIIVFIPFIFMTVIVSMLLYIFGLDIASGSIHYKCDQTNTTTTSSKNATVTKTTTNTNPVVFNPNYNSNAYNIPTPAEVNNYNSVSNNSSSQQSGALVILPNYSSSPPL
jgi:hypothetical protein